MRLLRNLLLALTSVGLVTTLFLTPHVAQAATYQDGDVIHLIGTPHLYVYKNGQAHWLSDIQAAQSAGLNWNRPWHRTAEEIRVISLGDPILSLPLVQDTTTPCCAIYLIKREGQVVRAHHIQSLSDVQTFGINEGNYGRFLKTKSEWESSQTLKLADLTKVPFSSTTGKVTIRNIGRNQTIPAGSRNVVFSLVSTEIDGMSLYGYPTSFGPGVNWTPASGGIQRGTPMEISIQINSNVPPGTYSGEGFLVLYPSGEKIPIGEVEVTVLRAS